jgi:signal transduction histidine kinase
METDETQSLKHWKTARKLARKASTKPAFGLGASAQALEQHSFIEVLRSELETLCGEIHLHGQLSAPDETVHLSADVENALLRIVQEAFNNIRKHAEAETVRVTLEQSDFDVRLTV